MQVKACVVNKIGEEPILKEISEAALLFRHTIIATLSTKR